MENRNRHSRTSYSKRADNEIPYPAKKTCSKCKTVMPASNFGKKRSEKNGLRTACKPCEAKAAKISYEKNRETRIASSAAWAAKNPEKKKELAKRTYYKNHASRRARCKIAYEANKAEVLARSKDAYHTNVELREKKKKASRVYYEDNSAARVDYQQQYRKLYPERYHTWTNNRRVRKKQADGKCSPDEWQAILEQFGGYCAYCLRHESDCGKLSIDHMTPLSKGGGNDADNLIPACKPCNSSKNKKSLLEYLAFRAGNALTAFN